MASLLSLPRELRDEIIDYVVQSSRPAPGKPDRDVSPTEVGRVQFDDMGWWNTFTRFKGNPTLFESSPDAFEPVFAGLLRTCRQLRTETLEREATAHVPYALDLLIVNGMDLWVTWLSMPSRPSPIIDHMKINLRVSGARRDAHLEDNRALNSDHFSYLAQRLLMRIIGRGTSGPIPDGNLDDVIARTDYPMFIGTHWDSYYVPHYCIRQLDVAFDPSVLKDPDELLADRFDDFATICSSRTENDPFYIQHPADYCSTLKHVLHTFFAWSTVEIAAPHQRALRERIGRVTISHAGVLEMDTNRFLGSDTLQDDDTELDGLWSDDLAEIIEARKRNGIHETGRKKWMRKSRPVVRV